VETLVLLPDIAERLQGDQAAAGGGRRQADAAGDIAERHLGMAGIEGFEDRQALGQRLDKLRRPFVCVDGPYRFLHCPILKPMEIAPSIAHSRGRDKVRGTSPLAEAPTAGAAVAAIAFCPLTQE